MARWLNRRKGSQRQATESETAPAPTVRVPQDQATHHSIYAEGLGQAHAGSLLSGSVSVTPYELRLVVSVCFIVVSLTPLAPTILPLSSSTGFPKLHLMFGYVPLPQLPAGAIERLWEHRISLGMFSSDLSFFGCLFVLPVVTRSSGYPVSNPVSGHLGTIIHGLLSVVWASR